MRPAYLFFLIILLVLVTDAVILDHVRARKNFIGIVVTSAI